jgi:hypothetical protein
MKTNLFRWRPRTHFEQVPLADVERIISDEEAPTDKMAPDNLDVVESARRLCPSCGKPLEWIERNSIEQREFDYYHRCLSGCGLYCYDLGARAWIKLA